MPIRNGIIKRYFDKYKLQKKKREEILAAVSESEAQMEQILGDEYVHFTEAIPEIGQFLSELATKEAVQLEAKQKREGTKIAEMVNLKTFIWDTEWVYI